MCALIGLRLYLREHQQIMLVRAGPGGIEPPYAGPREAYPRKCLVGAWPGRDESDKLPGQTFLEPLQSMFSEMKDIVLQNTVCILQVVFCVWNFS